MIQALNNNSQQKRKNVDSEEVPEIDRAEPIAALRQMKNRKALGENRITCEMLKVGGEPLLGTVLLLLYKCLSKGRNC